MPSPRVRQPRPVADVAREIGWRRERLLRWLRKTGKVRKVGAEHYVTDAGLRELGLLEEELPARVAALEEAVTDQALRLADVEASQRTIARVVGEMRGKVGRA